MNFPQTEPGAQPVIVEGIFAATPAQVFQAWTVADEVMQWFGLTSDTLISAHIDLRIGGKWRFVFERTPKRTTHFEGEYLEIVPDHKLVFSWSHVVQFADGPREETLMSRVSVVFRPHGQATQVYLRHEAIGCENGQLSAAQGWQASFANLRQQLQDYSRAGRHEDFLL